MNVKLLKHFIEDCPLNNFTETGNVDERRHKLDIYLEKLTNDLYKNQSGIIKQIWEENFAESQVLIIQQSAYLQRCLIFFDVVVTIYNEIATKYIKKRKSTKTADMLSVQIKNTFSIFKSMITLAMNGCFHSVLAEYRIMYESFVITKYLLLHPELIPIYYDHAKFLALHINEVSNNNTPEQKKQYNDYIAKYGNEFTKELGWTASIIKDFHKRKIKTLAKECNLEPMFEPMYRVSCNYVHASSLAATSQISPNFVIPFINVCIYMIDYEIVDFINECKVVKKEAVILKNLMEFIIDDLFKDFEKKEFF